MDTNQGTSHLDGIRLRCADGTSTMLMGSQATMKDITVVGNARCYHTMDWFRTIQSLAEPERRIEFVTDLIDSESHEVLVRPGDPIINLYNVDHLLLRRQSRFGNVWRNIVKLAFSPLQAWKLRRYHRSNIKRAYHAHTMYYMFVCWMAGIPFVGTPQGSEVLVRPFRSRFYRAMARVSLKAATMVTVDSVAMKEGIFKLTGVEALIIQNGVEVEKLASCRRNLHRSVVLSLRGFTDLYRIEHILRARDESSTKPSLTFIYPFWDDQYKAKLARFLDSRDRDMGRLDKEEMYALLGSTKLAISIPRSDSSPRSVYESIFAGACVAATWGAWYDALPECMKSRIYLVNLEQADWLDEAIRFADASQTLEYRPSKEAIEQFSQSRSMRNAIRILYT